MLYINYTAIKRDFDMKDELRKGEEDICTEYMNVHLIEVRCKMYTHITCLNIEMSVHWGCNFESVLLYVFVRGWTI